MMSEGQRHLAMTKRLYGILLGTQLLGTSIAVAQQDIRPVPNPQRSGIQLRAAAGTTGLGKSGTNAAIAIAPRILDFGAIAIGNSKRLSFSVQNAGVGILSGAANVSAPFNIVGGSPYQVSNSQTQTITVQYAPKSMGIYIAVVHLTGGGGASITVMGSAAPGSPKAPTRRRAPASPKNLRLIAGR